MNSKYIGILVFFILLALVIVFNKNDIILTGQYNFKLQPISANGFLLQSDIYLYNPNVLSCTVKSIREKFRLNGVILGILDQEINQGIPGWKESVFPVSIRFSKDDYNRAVGNDSANTLNPNIWVEGEIVYGKVVGGGTIKVNQSSTDSSGSSQL